MYEVEFELSGQLCSPIRLALNWQTYENQKVKGRRRRYGAYVVRSRGVRGKIGITKMCSLSVHPMETVVQMPSDKDVEPPFPEELDRSLLPKHVAIIMDGNSRWAERKGWPATMGHEAGVRALKEVVNLARGWGIEVLTVFAFSTENWLRPKVKPHTNAI